MNNGKKISIAQLYLLSEYQRFNIVTLVKYIVYELIIYEYVKIDMINKKIEQAENLNGIKRYHGLLLSRFDKCKSISIELFIQRIKVFADTSYRVFSRIKIENCVFNELKISNMIKYKRQVICKKKYITSDGKCVLENNTAERYNYNNILSTCQKHYENTMILNDNEMEKFDFVFNEIFDWYFGPISVLHYMSTPTIDSKIQDYERK
jgi:hypothetical protein